MADNTVLNAGTGGDTIATDDLAGVKHQLVKVEFGADGAATMVQDAGGARLPVKVGDALPAGTNNIGDVDIASQPDLSAEHTRNEAFAQAVAVGGELDDTAPVAATEGNVSPLRITAQRAAHANLRKNDGTELGTVTDPLRVDPTGTTTQPISGTVTANLAAGTNNIGDVDVLTLPALPAGTNNIGDVDVVTLPALPAGNNNIGDVDIASMPNVTLAAGTNTNEVVGDVAHDAAAAGNPLGVGAIAQDMDDTAPPNRVSAEGDAVRIAADRDGAQFVHPHGPQLWSYHSDGSTALTDATVHAAPGAGLSLYVTDIIVGKDAATAMNIFFEEGATKVLGPWYLEAIAGRGLALHFQTPKKITPNTALTVTTSANIAHSVDVMGYTAQG